MKKNIKTIYLLEILMLIQCIILIILYKKINPEIVSTIFLFIITIISIKKLNFKKDNNIQKKSTIRTIITILLSTTIITYTLGILLGFTKGYSLLSKNILIYGFIPTTIMIILNEIIRYIIFSNSYKNKKIIVIFTILSIILNIILRTNTSLFENGEKIFIYISTTIFPIISEEILCTYITYKIGLTPSLIYKLATRLYIYIIPIIPNLGNYIHSVIFILLPYIVYMSLNKNKLIEEKKTKKLNLTIISIPLFLITGIIIILTSGIFKYKIIAIATNSMNPVFKRGDAIIYKKTDIKTLKEGDTIAFKYEGITITHRIVNIEYKNNKYYFETKGDNNPTKDGFITSETQILGKVKYIIKYIGYPTIFINEQIRKD